MSESDSDPEVDDPLSNLPDGYSVFELNDGWPPANRYAEHSLVAVPPVPRPNSVTKIPDAISEELAGEKIDDYWRLWLCTFWLCGILRPALILYIRSQTEYMRLLRK
jgi:hypothetical protein